MYFIQDTPRIDDNFCIIREPVLKYFSYNFTTLTNPEKDVVINLENDTNLRLQLCSPLKEKCNGKDGYGICLVKNKVEKGIGKLPPKVNVKDGRILFIFTGDDCMPDTNYTVNILMKCDYEAGNSSYSDVIYDAKLQPCNIYLIWKTSFACGPRTTIQNCSVTENGLHYDLSPLTSYSHNYVIYMSNKVFPKIILNVCHSVIFEYGALCLHSGACLQNSSKTEYVNLGMVEHPPFIEDGKLKLKYVTGDMCKVRNVALPHIMTTINFICDFKADTDPEYIGGGEVCNYHIRWKTAAACSVESLRDHSIATAGKCTVNNPLTNFMYDLRPLMNKNFYTLTNNGMEYEIGICESLVDKSCVSGTVCITKNRTSLGKANTNLMWEEGKPYLNYTDGDSCGNGQQRYTIIAFICGTEGFPDGPFIMEQNTCQTIIHWNTTLVCEKRVKCATDDDEINLSSLIKSDSNYIIKMNETKFLINICGPLVPVSGLSCAHGSAICKTTLNSNNEYINEISLGFPKESPIINKNRETVLRYGFPEFKKYEDCTYVFEWKTSITCGASIGNWTSPCIIRDQLLSHECNLSLLHKNKKVYYVKNKQGKKYSISIYSGEKICDGSAVCQGSNGYGSLANVIFDYGRDVIKLQYFNGSKCGNSSYTSEVRFICNKSVGIGAPKLLWLQKYHRAHKIEQLNKEYIIAWHIYIQS
ncbi:Cation-independent mannose-6-phosphate receptor [Eufriesea mexicana]|uniref:Cation-independent mannose-6-phosphate receptor n=1 Tax=Eufriesea mexicana TaxID=516756 RepID=A0A310SF73_9HYME|nr:Cation-independent mannose-6-phosphate receptor [Eufriesea mexicana]